MALPQHPEGGLVAEPLGARTEEIQAEGGPMAERRAQSQPPNPGKAGPSGYENQDCRAQCLGWSWWGRERVILTVPTPVAWRSIEGWEAWPRKTRAASDAVGRFRQEATHKQRLLPRPPAGSHSYKVELCLKFPKLPPPTPASYLRCSGVICWLFYFTDAKNKIPGVCSAQPGQSLS